MSQSGLRVIERLWDAVPKHGGASQMAQQERWQVAGTAANIYEQDLVPAVFGPWAPLVVDLAPPRPGDRVLDVACGTGIVARCAAEGVGSTGAIVGVDLNPGMLAIARSTAAKYPTIQWVEGSADKLHFPSESFDIVYCQLGLQYFPDREAALREMRRVLRAAGRLGLMVWRRIDESPGFAALAHALERHVSAEAAAIMQAPFCLSDSDALATLVRSAGFEDVAIAVRTGTVRFPSAEVLVYSFVAGSPLAAHVPKAALEHLAREVRTEVRPFTEDSVLAFPITAQLLSARV
jgi:ubiquinone/menaquinone biosynthesis C-methylase UbiE